MIDFQPPADLGRLKRLSLAIGGVVGAVCLLGAFLNPGQFLRSYLVAFLLWLGVALGCLAISMLHHLTGGDWGVVIRRGLEAASRTLPFLALLFVPVALGLHHIFEWSHEEVVAADELLRHKQPYLNQPFFILRAAFYFLLWTGFAFTLSKLSRRQDETGDPKLYRRMQTVSAVGLGLYCLTSTFAAVDWLMSLDPHWFSSLFGIYFIGGQGLSALAFIILVAVYLAGREPMKGVIQPRHLHDHGKLMFAFVMLWAYFSISQFLIIWSANLPEEITFYVHRTHGGWQYVTFALILLHFLLPFILLLSRDLKRSGRLVSRVAMLILAVRWLDLFWQAAPAHHPDHLVLHWLDLLLPVALGGLWFSAFVDQLQKSPLLPLQEPHLAEAIAHE